MGVRWKAGSGEILSGDKDGGGRTWANTVGSKNDDYVVGICLQRGSRFGTGDRETVRIPSCIPVDHGYVGSKLSQLVRFSGREWRSAYEVVRRDTSSIRVARFDHND